jgi:hypothetical protein
MEPVHSPLVAEDLLPRVGQQGIDDLGGLAPASRRENVVGRGTVQRLDGRVSPVD